MSLRSRICSLERRALARRDQNALSDAIQRFYATGEKPDAPNLRKAIDFLERVAIVKEEAESD